MPRMFVEGQVGTHDTPRAAAAALMAELDAVAAQQGHRVVGDVTIATAEDAYRGRILRLEADVIPAT